MSTTGELTQPQPSLHDLPIEIIHELLHYLVDQNHLLTLAQVSRHLNSIVTSFYFPGRSANPHHLDSITLHFYDFYTTSFSPCISRILVNAQSQTQTQSPHSDTTTTTTAMRKREGDNHPQVPPTRNGNDVLAFLSIAFDIHTITNLEWEFAGVLQAWPGPDATQRLIKQQRHFVLLLRRLQGVTKISVNFTSRQGMMVYPPTQGLLDDWTDVMVELLNLSLGKLVVDEDAMGAVDRDKAWMVLGGYRGDGYFLKASGTWEFLMPNTKIFGIFQDTKYPTLRGQGREVLREPIRNNSTNESGSGGEDPVEEGDDDTNPISNAVKNITLSPTARSYSKSITTYTISSPILLFPPLSEWTYQFLSTTPLTSLSLTSLQYPYKWWSVILSWLSTPISQLRQFTMRNCGPDIPPPALSKFINNLTNLIECNIDIPSSLVTLPWDFTTSNLPSTLRKFTAPSEFIWFTRPKGLRVFNRKVLGVKSNRWERLGVVLTLKKTTMNDFNVDEVLKMYEDVEWVVLDLKGTKPEALDTACWPPCLWRSKDDENDSDNDNDNDEEEEGDGVDEEREVPGYYGAVKEVVLSMEMMGYFMTETGFTKRLVDLLGIFKGLKVLQVVGRSRVDPTTIIANPTGEYGWVRPQWLDSLKAACESLELVELEVEGREGKVVLRDFR